MLHIRPLPIKTFLAVFVLLALASALSHQSGLDRLVAHAVYQLEGGSGGRFPWRDSYSLYDFLHEGGRYLVKRLFFLNIALLVASWFVARLRAYRQVFVFIAISTFISTSLISYLKHLTTIPCPEALIEFGGDRRWINIWQVMAANLPRGGCYPAGHSSGGYGWLCLAFIFPFASKKFYLWLLPGLTLGLVFGIAQQLRGVHFISHDLLTISLCWLIPGVVLYLMQLMPVIKQQLGNNKAKSSYSRVNSAANLQESL